MKENENAKKILNQIVDLFQSGNVPEAIAKVVYTLPDIPIARWSLSNRLVVSLSGTQDARTYKQWQEAGRQVKKGAKAVHILAPRIIKKTEGEGETEVEKTFCAGFFTIPVFPVEQTEGKELEYSFPDVNNLPLIEKAKAWGISVNQVFCTEDYYGCYSPSKKVIKLATPEQKTFFHELAHVAHGRTKQLKAGQDAQQEIVAELTSQVLAQFFGSRYEETAGETYKYIEYYAKQQKKSVGAACLSVIGEVEKVLKEILN